MKKFLRPVFSVLVLAVVTLTGAARAADYTFQLTNSTGLSSSEYLLYVMGFSYGSELVLGPAGTFVSQSSGTVSSYPVGTGGGQISEITMDTSTAFTGGRIYFFIVPVGNPTVAPSVDYGKQPTNPPSTDFPPYTIVEITVPAPAGNPVTDQPATIDVQTVDGFVFPITVTIGGQFNVAGQQYGQPIYQSGQTPTVNRAAIFEAYTTFMQGEGTAGAPYLDLTYGAGTVATQAAGILNPAAYVLAADGLGQYLNLGSSLNTIFNADLTTLFAQTGLRIQGVASGSGDSGPVIAPDSYEVTSTADQIYPGTAISLPALQLTGETNGLIFTVFNPVGLSVLTGDDGQAISGTIDGTELTLASPASGVEIGMYVSGAGLSPVNDQSTVTVTAINGNVLTLSSSQGNPAPNSQYTFSRLPYLTMFQTPGQMVFGNSGVFADNTIQYAAGTSHATVLGSMENWIVTALNRGVALNATALSPVSPGGTSLIWGDQTYWYPAGAVQNLFSLFMHAGMVGTEHIFTLPVNAASWTNARGQVMASAYGFPFDENGGPVPPAPVGQPEVPSKFDQNVPVGATMQITFGPWTAGAAPTPAPTPTPVPAPSVKVDGKKTVKTSARQVKLKGQVVGDELFVKYKKKPGRILTKPVKIKGNGTWVFKLKPTARKTVLKFYSENSAGARSKVQKVKVIDENK